jgi:LPXTG-site transpeptidase (sortase) family protein
VPVPSAVASAPIGTHPALLGEAPSPSPGPARIVIPRLDVAAPVVAVSVGSGGQLAVPPTTSEAAWYAGGPVPGEAGSAVIAAHVDYNGRPGVFFQLDQLTVGDQIIVIDAVGSSHTFVVRSRGEYAKTTLPTAQIFSRAGPPTLTLVTCGGEFRPALHSYADNIVVQATPIAA